MHLKLLTDNLRVDLAVVMVAQSMSILAPQFTAITNAAAAAAELFGIMENSSELDPLDPSGRQPDACAGQITIRNVDFVYPSRPSTQVLRDFSIDIPAGKTTALVGASGSGKSTMVGLLERWYNPLNGSIMLDGVELSDYNTKWLRSNIRLVQQVSLVRTPRVLQADVIPRNLYYSRDLYLITLLKVSWTSSELLVLMTK